MYGGLACIITHHSPAALLQGGTLGMWPKPYRNKTRQVMPNSVHEWKCSAEAANFTAAASSSAPVLQSCELRSTSQNSQGWRQCLAAERACCAHALLAHHLDTQQC